MVLHTNDHHDHPVKFYNYPAPDLGGIPARATLISQIRSEHDHVLVLDAGDINTGRPESNFFKAEPDILGYNACGYDALALGNHEFDNPLTVLQKQISLAEFPFLSANVLTSDGSYLDNVLPYIIKDFGGFKAAVFGLPINSTPSKVTPNNIKGLVFQDEVETARDLVPELEQQADIVIALVHLGLYDSEAEGSRSLAAEVPGIDLIIDGHSHTRRGR